MANISTLEPQAYGLVVLHTTFGDLELELFTKQCPKISRNFVQLCLDGYYDDSIFHRVEKDFIAIGGKLDNPTGLEIVADKCPDEFHSRLKFSRRGLLATANTQKDANGPEFFFTLGATPELQNKHSIFGRVKGNSVYYLVDLNECPVDDDMVPISEKRILHAEVVENPFQDLKARPDVAERLSIMRDALKPKKVEDEHQLEPKFDINTSKKLSFYPDSDEDEDSQRDTPDEPTPDSQNKESTAATTDDLSGQVLASGPIDISEKQNSSLSEDARAKRLREIREQIQNIKSQFELASATKIRTLADRRRLSQDQDSSLGESMKSNSSKQSNIEDPDVSEQELRLATKKGRHRERETLDLLESFKKKLKQSKFQQRPAQVEKADQGATTQVAELHAPEGGDDDDDKELAKALAAADGDVWLHHKFDADDGGTPRLAKDANHKGDDWYSVDDPRNPLVKRVMVDKACDYRSHYGSRREGGNESRVSSSARKDSRRHHHR